MSQLYGGRITDSQLTLLCGIIDLVEHGDEFLADKGFPQVRVIFFHAFVTFYVHTVSCLLKVGRKLIHPKVRTRLEGSNVGRDAEKVVVFFQQAADSNSKKDYHFKVFLFCQGYN